jgi:hypothetical protein
VIAPTDEEAPARLAEYAGRPNVLMTHPFDREKAAALERAIEVPNGKKTTLSFAVAADDQGDWELRVLVDGKSVHKQLVDKQGSRWKTVNIDLSPYAGQKVTVRLENWANDWAWEYGYWNQIELRTTQLTAVAK